MKKLCAVESTDRISDLPDDVIGLILSLVPFVDAVRTSVLSRDWEHKWTFVRDIECTELCESGIPKDKTILFINFVTRALNRSNSRLRSFSLACFKRYDPSFIETWISMVLARNVEKLKIHGFEVGRLDSHWCFSGWTSLTELDLILSCTLVVPLDNYCFRNLKKLHLSPNSSYGNLKIKTLEIPTGGCISLKFPVLEKLSLSFCEWLDVNFVEIHAPELTSFCTNCLEERKDYEIKIFAAKLAMFESRGSLIENFDLHTPAVSCAKLFHISPTNEQEYQTTLVPRTHRILKQVSSVKYLQLSGDFAKAFKTLISSTMLMLVYPFGRLEELHLRFFSGYNYEDTLNLLQVLPSLVRLTISVLFWYDNYERKKTWQPIIVSNMKEIKINGFCQTNMQFDFLKFVLENASNLEMMRVHLYEQSDYVSLIKMKISVWKKLAKLKPRSSKCQVIVEYTEG